MSDPKVMENRERVLKDYIKTKRNQLAPALSEPTWRPLRQEAEGQRKILDEVEYLMFSWRMDDHG